MSQSGTPSKARLRTFPWPYRAALAFSNDCDFLTLPAMLGLHHLFGTPKAESGLELELSDSFFFYQRGAHHPTYSYFEGLSAKPSTAAPIIRAMVGAGYIDTTHALGDFETGGFSRNRALRALSEFQRYGLSIAVWSNHGGFGNIQNIGRKEFAYQHSGDDLLRPYYVLDIAEDFGVRYVWPDGYVAKRLPLSPTGRVVTEQERRAPRELVIQGVQTIQNDYRPLWTHDRTEAFASVNTRVGCRLQGFVRYNPFLPGSDAELADGDQVMPDGRRPGPNAGRIANALTPRLLESLVQAEGCAFLYQHLSTLAHLPQRRHMSELIEFHPDNLEALRQAKSYEDRGLIWIAAQAILLDYLYVRNTVDATVRQLGDSTWAVEVGLRDGFEARNISGLSVEIPSPCERVIFVLPDGGTREGLSAGPDGDGAIWAYLPVRRLPAMDWPQLGRMAGLELPSRPRVTLLDGSQPVSLWLPGSERGGGRKLE